MNTIRAILLENIEEQSNLWLSILIAKLVCLGLFILYLVTAIQQGDPDKKVVSSVAKILLELSKVGHLKETFVKELTIFARRPQCPPRARYAIPFPLHVLFASLLSNCSYYGVSILGQTELSKTEVEIANILVVTYFSMFKEVLAHGADTRLLAVLISGAAKALPIARVQYEAIAKYTSYLFSVVKVATMVNSVKALALLYQLMKANNLELTSEFYDALYSKLSSPSLHKTAALGLLLNLLLKVIKSDSNQQRCRTFVKTMLAVSTHGQPHLTCAAIVLLDQISKDAPVIAKMAFHTPQNLATTDDSSLLWELVALRNHYHPAVSKLTELYFSRSPEVYSGQDPLSQYSLASFLDSFVKEQSVEVAHKNLENAPLRVIKKLTVQVSQSDENAPEKVRIIFIAFNATNFAGIFPTILRQQTLKARATRTSHRESSIFGIKC